MKRVVFCPMLADHIDVTRERPTNERAADDMAIQVSSEGARPVAAGASGDVAATARLLESQPARREEIIAELHRTHGNAFVQQVLAASGNGLRHEQAHQEESARDGGNGVSSEVRNSADTTKAQILKQERFHEASDNATYRAMNAQLKLLAAELQAGAKNVSLTVALANAATPKTKAETEAIAEGLTAGLDPAYDLAMTTSKQLRDIRVVENDPRLADGGQALLAALGEIAPVLAAADAWSVAHKRDAWGVWPVQRVTNGIVKVVFPNLVPPAKPLTKAEQSRNVMNDAAIDAHLDAAIAAAQSCLSGNTNLDSDRLILHAKEMTELLKGHARISGQLTPRIQKLLRLADKILVDNPWRERSFNEALGPLRDVK